MVLWIPLCWWTAGWHMQCFTLGLSIFMHGLVRLPHLSAFADNTAELFMDTPLPAFTVRLFALGLAFVETAVGLLVLLGLWTRWALFLGALTMAALVFGTALRSDWNTLAIQMLYALIYAALIDVRIALQKSSWRIEDGKWT